MRARLTQEKRNLLFLTARKKFESWNALARHFSISPRNLTDWRRGKISLPLEKFEALLQISGLKKEFLRPEILPDFWHAHKAGQRGAAARMELYGNPGTPEGRRKGGMASLATHQKNQDGFICYPQDINCPPESELLAEFLGIMIGDGHLAEYQASMSTNSITDIQHAHFVAQTIHDLFGVVATLRPKKDENTLEVVASSKSLVQYIHSLGMPLGNKNENHVAMPDWIIQNLDYQKAFLRGLFDTDGSVYLDHHLIKGINYWHVGWTITSFADRLRADICGSLLQLGYLPTNTFPQKSVFLRRQGEIAKYFREIGSHNEKHILRYQKFMAHCIAPPTMEGSPNGMAPLSKSGVLKGT